MKLARLFQPRNPLFWMVLALHALTMGLVWMLHNRPLSTFGVLLLGGLALCNALLGMWLSWRLARTDVAPPAPKPSSQCQDKSSY